MRIQTIVAAFGRAGHRADVRTNAPAASASLPRHAERETPTTLRDLYRPGAADPIPGARYTGGVPVFTPEFAEKIAPGAIASAGWYLAARRSLEARGALQFVRDSGEASYSPAQVGDLAAALRRTRAIDALNAGRKWPLERFFAELDPLLESGIALAVVPGHDPFIDDPPIRRLAQRLAQSRDRIDATGCLVRHTKIRRIVWGGPSYVSLHRQTIRVAEAQRLAGRAVLLLDDVVRSGASLRACRALLREAGAAEVAALALGRVAR